MKGILAARTEAEPAPEPTGDGGAAAHRHGPSQLFANVVALPTPNPPPTGNHATTGADHDTDHQADAHDGHGDHHTAAPAKPNRATADSEEAS